MRRVRRPKRGSQWRLGSDAERVTDEFMRREFCDSHLVFISHFGWVFVGKPVESPWAPHATRYAGTRFAMRVRSEAMVSRQNQYAKRRLTCSQEGISAV